MSNSLDRNEIRVLNVKKPVSIASVRYTEHFSNIMFTMYGNQILLVLNTLKGVSHRAYVELRNAAYRVRRN